MRKALLAIGLILLLAACGNNEVSQSQNSTAAASEPQKEATDETVKEDDESIGVDKGLMNVEVTFPPSLLEADDGSINIEQIKAEAEEQGIDEVMENEDGSVTYKMSKSKHEELMKDYQAEMQRTIDDLVNSGDFPSIQEIEHNDSFSEFTMVVDGETFTNSFDGIAAFSLGMTGMIYQLFDGVSPDNYEVVINVEDGSSGELIDTVVYPGDLEQENE